MERERRRSTLLMAFGALGIVFGDIGTSPLYALHEASHVRGLPAGEMAALGVMSLIFWTLNLIVSVESALHHVGRK